MFSKIKKNKREKEVYLQMNHPNLHTHLPVTHLNPNLQKVEADLGIRKRKESEKGKNKERRRRDIVLNHLLYPGTGRKEKTRRRNHKRIRKSIRIIVMTEMTINIIKKEKSIERLIENIN